MADSTLFPALETTCGFRRGTAAGGAWHRRRGEPLCYDCMTKLAHRTPLLRDDLSNWRFG